MGTIRSAYVQAVANQVHTRLVPPAAKAGSTTAAGSRRMSGQSKVEDSTVAAAPNASAPTANSPPVVRRSPWRTLSIGMGSAPLNGGQDSYGLQDGSTVPVVASRVVRLGRARVARNRSISSHRAAG